MFLFSSLMLVSMEMFFFLFFFGLKSIYRFIEERTPNWFNTLKELFQITPSAAVGEVKFPFPCCW